MKKNRKGKIKDSEICTRLYFTKQKEKSGHQTGIKYIQTTRTNKVI